MLNILEKEIEGNKHNEIQSKKVQNRKPTNSTLAVFIIYVTFYYNNDRKLQKGLSEVTRSR